MPERVDAPERLPQPTVAEMDLPVVMDALSDPIRLAIMHRYLVDAAGGVRSCGWVGVDRPKSTLTHHFRVLREAGLLEQHREGLTRSSRARIDDVQERFPGLLDLVFAWQVPAALMRSDIDL
ncbi:ArsR family transcriptional regulator [Curtobacterium sp. PhB130]|uniref:ArsR/SmtB family transcription factor n=1 Tax=unclassified Curtobacterium TaxID=257496 RepID=UPI000F4BDEE6|nr:MULTISPECIES: helix-turn-helix domain-containing protein [unclassified Curtobacterium]ROP61265.1 ArsR family transcriptional regulator [Curtobacterium sp. ZW137]ROS75632.1 ArsR family transcriptional regulator [Curtobacterium sp. PhB130]TCK64642.1 ArsR family transcriptional regulator [Curtobacterium sp. PhB136]